MFEDQESWVFYIFCYNIFALGMQVNYDFSISVVLLMYYLFPGGMMAFLHSTLEEMD
jgi:hypothetical protein